MKYFGIQAVNALGWLSIAFAINRFAVLLGLGDFIRIPFKKIAAVLGVTLQWLKALLTLMFSH
jgi:hypothetical protein